LTPIRCKWKFAVKNDVETRLSCGRNRMRSRAVSLRIRHLCNTLTGVVKLGVCPCRRRHTWLGVFRYMTSHHDFVVMPTWPFRNHVIMSQFVECWDLFRNEYGKANTLLIWPETDSGSRTPRFNTAITKACHWTRF